MNSSRLRVPIIVILAFVAALAGWVAPLETGEPEPIPPAPVFVFAEIVQAAEAFAAILEPEQRAKALFEFEDAERHQLAFGPA